MYSDLLVRLFYELHPTEDRHIFSTYQYLAFAIVLSAATVLFSVIAASGEKPKQKAENAETLLKPEVYSSWVPLFGPLLRMAWDSPKFISSLRSVAC